MRLRLAVSVLVLALAACGASAARSGGAACGPSHGQTIAADSVARVYSLNGKVYGCAGPKQYLLGRASLCIGSARVGPVVIAGRLAAYGLERCGVDTGFTEVIVRSLADGRQRSSAAAITGPLRPESYESVGSLVLRPDGAVAWIADGRSIVGGPARIEVHKGMALLDTGGGIALGSLKLHGSKLTWKHGPKTRTASLR
jgi:hypothetical protein